MYTPYIPKEHIKYDILPNSKKNNWEVVSYDSDMLDKLQKYHCKISYPYHPVSLESLYKEIDDCIIQYPKLKNLLLKYKKDLIIRNNKLNWGIVKYIGKSNQNFTNNHYYYVPMFEKNGTIVVDGIIDDEEFTSYIGWSEDTNISTIDIKRGFIANEDIKMVIPRDFEIIIDPYKVLSK